MSDTAARGAGELIMQLVRLSLLEISGQKTSLTQREALKERIRGYVALNLRDPRLSIERIAHALNCSKRGRARRIVNPPVCGAVFLHPNPHCNISVRFFAIHFR